MYWNPADSSGNRCRKRCVLGYATSRRKRRSMMNRLLSRKTKSIALGRAIHLLPGLVGYRSGNLAGDLFELAGPCAIRRLSQRRISRLYLALKAAVDRVRCGHGGLRRRSNHSDRPATSCDDNALSSFDAPKNPGGLILQFAHTNLRFLSHVATNVARFSLNQSQGSVPSS
jgi:hypothetical protein